MTAQAPYESLTTVEAIQKAQADGRTVELNRAPRWEETNLRDEKNIAAFLRTGAEFRAALPERAPVSAGGDALSLAIRFHETYERLAPSFGYETRTETRAFDQATPNGRLMVAVCGELLAALAALRQRIAELEGERDEAVRQRVCYSLAVNRIDDYIEHRGPGSFYGGEIDKKRIHAIFAKLSAALAGDAQEGEA